MKIAVISAMDNEHRQLTERLQNRTEYKEGAFKYVIGKLGNNELILTQCGIGKVNAAIGCSILINKFHPDCIINTGVAGGIDTYLKVTDVVIGNKYVYNDVWCGEGNKYGQVQGMPELFYGDQALIKYALSLNGKENVPDIKEGLICTGDKFITDKTSLQAIKSTFPEGLAVDMESTAIAQVCFIFKTPFLSFRIISDIPGDYNHSEMYNNFWETLCTKSFDTTWTFLENIPEEIIINKFTNEKNT